MRYLTGAVTTLALVATMQAAHAVPIAIVNASFEDDANNFNEFYFGNPTGWSLLDPGGIIDGVLDVQGTLTVTGSPYFGGVAPDGDNVALLFIGTDVGTSEVGLAQVLATILTANTSYSLAVDVGNIESGPTVSGDFFDLSGFPGYRIELLAGGLVLAQAEAGIDAPIGEGEFATVVVDFVTGAAHAQLGQALEIRLYNRNLADPAFPGVDLEVDFDNVRLDAAAVVRVPEPATSLLLAAGIGMVMVGRRRVTAA